MSQKNTTQAIEIAADGIKTTSDPGARSRFAQIINLLDPTDAREEKLEPRVKAARKAAKKR